MALNIDCPTESQRFIVRDYPYQAAISAPKKPAITQMIQYRANTPDRAPVDNQTEDLINAAINLRRLLDLVIQMDNRTLGHSHDQNDLAV